MKSISLIILSLYLCGNYAHAELGLTAANIFKGISPIHCRDNTDKKYFCLPFYERDPNKYLMEEALTDSKQRCYIHYQYCTPITSTFELVEWSDGSIYGLIYVRGSNSNPDSPVKPNPSGRRIIPPFGSKCVFSAHDFERGSDNVKYDVYIQYARSEDCAWINRTSYISLSQFKEYFEELQFTGVCEKLEFK